MENYTLSFSNDKSAPCLSPNSEVFCADAVHDQITDCLTDNFSCLQGQGIAQETAGCGYYNYEFLKVATHTLRVFRIHCEEKCHALFIADCNNCVRVWINGALRGLFEGNRRMLIFSLESGDNTVGLEIEETTPTTTLFLRISQFEAEKKVFPSPVNGTLTYTGNLGFVKHLGQHLYNGEPFYFAFFPNNDLISENETFDFRLINAFTKETLYSDKLPVRQEHSLDLSAYQVSDYDDGNGLVAELKYGYSDGTCYSSTIPLYTKSLDTRLKHIYDRANHILKRDSLTEYDRFAVQFGVEYISKYGRSLAPILSQASLLRGSLDRIEEHGHADDNFYVPGIRRVFFYNALYKAINYYRILIPDDYDPTRKYPLLVIFSTIEYGAWCQNFKHYTKEPLFVADVSGRGVLLGSYMGDASIQIALSDIFSKYSIDRTRVYCTGNSNGAGTAWAQAEAYPDLYAGIYAVSGQPNYELLKNLGNQKIIALSSDADDMNPVFQKVRKSLSGHSDLTAIEALGYSHQALHLIWFNEQLFEQLLEARLNPFPNQIYFRTLSNRHRKAYWLEIHSLAEGAAEATIEAQIVGTVIELRGSEITGFSLTVPPQLRGLNIELSWNGKFLCSVEDATDLPLHFVKAHSSGDAENGFFTRIYYDVPVTNLYQGYGLLDVYLDPLTVITPDGCGQEVTAVANAYAEPMCNGFIPKIYVSYPILSFSKIECNAQDWYSRSMVVIDDFSADGAFIEKLREEAPIKVRKSGWSYGGHDHEENYCIQQIFENPWNRERSVLLICANDRTLFRRNFFTRKVIIPTYANGYHKYWNADALIYNGRYFSIPDWRTEKIDEI